MMHRTPGDLPMVVPNPPITRVSLHTADGQVQIDVVPAEEYERLRAELESLRERLAEAERQRDHHLAKVKHLLTTRFPPLPTPEEMADPSLWATSDDIQRLIADLEAR